MEGSVWEGVCEASGDVGLSVSAVDVAYYEV